MASRYANQIFAKARPVKPNIVFHWKKAWSANFVLLSTLTTTQFCYYRSILGSHSLPELSFEKVTPWLCQKQKIQSKLAWEFKTPTNWKCFIQGLGKVDVKDFSTVHLHCMVGSGWRGLSREKVKAKLVTKVWTCGMWNRFVLGECFNKASIWSFPADC